MTDEHIRTVQPTWLEVLRIKDTAPGARMQMTRSAVVAVYSDKKGFIFKAVVDMHSDVATHPGKAFHFPTGRLACLFVGYPNEQLDLLPATAPESFAGVGYPFAAGVILEGDRILDIGSGSASVDVITSNGVLNLVPDKPRVFAEIIRVLKPSGRLQIADIALATPTSDRARANPKLWAECVVGAVVEDDYVAQLRAAGLSVEVVGRLDYFAGSVNPDTRRVAPALGAHTIVPRGAKA